MQKGLLGKVRPSRNCIGNPDGDVASASLSQPESEPEAGEPEEEPENVWEPEEEAEHCSKIVAYVKQVGSWSELEWDELLEERDMAWEEADGLAQGILKDIAHEEAKEVARRRSSWTKWKETQLQGSGGKLFKWIKPIAKWEPPRVIGRNGKAFSSPSQIVQEEKERLEDIWQVGACRMPRRSVHCVPGPIIDPEALRSTSRKYKLSTGIGLDGWHM